MSEISRSAASIRFYGPDLDPEMLSQLLGASPTRSGRKGEPQSGSDGDDSRTNRTGFWLIDYGEPDETDLEEKVESLLRKLTDNLEIWQEITAAYQVDVFCGLFLDGWNEGFELSPELMKKLADRGLPIGFDIYSPTDSWENN